jgi:hypothetical protein
VLCITPRSARADAWMGQGLGDLVRCELTKEYRPWTPEQAFLLPPSPIDWLPEGHRAYFVLELVRELDVSAIEDAIQSKDARGVRPYSPRMMTAPVLYAYCVRRVLVAQNRACHLPGRRVSRSGGQVASTPSPIPDGWRAREERPRSSRTRRVTTERAGIDRKGNATRS